MVVKMENRELTMEDYVAMLRRRIKVILIPALLAPLTGYMVSYAFPPRYTSQSLILVEAPKIPDAVVQQVFTQDLTEHIATIEQRVLSPNRLRPMVERLGLVKPGQNIEDVVDGIRVRRGSRESLEPPCVIGDRVRVEQLPDLAGYLKLASRPQWLQVSLAHPAPAPQPQSAHAAHASLIARTHEGFGME